MRPSSVYRPADQTPAHFYLCCITMGLKLMLLFLGLLALASAKSYTCDSQICENIVSLVYDTFRNISGVNITFNVSKETNYEWESYDGWYHNIAHPDWGGADMPLERKEPAAYGDGVYEIAGKDRPITVLISNMTQFGFTGNGSMTRTGFFIFFGQQVVEDMLDVQLPGCIPEYENMPVPKCHPLFDPNCQSERYIPFLRSRYDFRTGYSPGNPRQQLNEITPWFDGTLIYGPAKGWADALRAYSRGELAANNQNYSLADQVPAMNTIGLPYANAPPPANHTLLSVNRFWTIGNPRGNENPFLQSMQILWFRVHNMWARYLVKYAKENNLGGQWLDDEFIFNRARQFTIATHQHIVYDEWMPIFLRSKLLRLNRTTIPEYESNPGYSLYYGRTGYNPSINPQVAHAFQTAAMRFGHTMVTPGIWRRPLRNSSNDACLFGSTATKQNSYLKLVGETAKGAKTTSPGEAGDPRQYSMTQIAKYLTNNFNNASGTGQHQDFLSWLFNDSANINISSEVAPGAGVYSMYTNRNQPSFNKSYTYGDAPAQYFSVRTCNSYFNPQAPIIATNVDPLFLGMASQRCEHEDFVITPDLRGNVFGPLDFSRRDLMAINMQRARDHGLPDYNTIRAAFGLPRLSGFEQLNPYYGVRADVTENIERLREVYNNDVNKCDMWTCGILETTDNGPGTLFSEVLFDQFMRIRHGDRFWYENWRENLMFTESEFYAIKNLTMKKILLLITNIKDFDISDHPFEFTKDTVCPQPFQLTEFFMDDCTALQGRDYYADIGSDWMVPFIWGLVFIYIAIVILVMFVIASYNKHTRAKLFAHNDRKKGRNIAGDDVQNSRGEILLATEEKSGLKATSRHVNIKLGPGKRIVLHLGGVVLRTVDLEKQKRMMIQTAVDDPLYCLLRLSHECDIILRCQEFADCPHLIEQLRAYCQRIGIEVNTESFEKAKYLLRGAFTKKHRQEQLEEFFKSIFQEQALASGAVDLEYELTRQEFAEAMSLKADSLFVEQMFQLIDADGNGFISFQEFLNMSVIFSKGSPEDKLKLMFDMYDANKSGFLHRDQFKKMLKSMMELVNATVSAEQMDNLVETMFVAAGFQNKQELTLGDFNLLLRDHKEELSNARMQLTTIDVPDIEVKKELPGAEATPTRYQKRETATARASRTVVRAYARTQAPRAKKSVTDELDSNENVADIPTVKDKPTFKFGAISRRWNVFTRYVENMRLQIFYLSLFFLITAGIFVERAYYYSTETEQGGLRRIAGYGVTITRGAASGMMWTYSVLLITMSRNFITYLRETPFNYYVPFDSYIAFHKIVAFTALLFTITHCIGHGLNFYHISTETASDLSCIFREVYYRTHYLPSFLYWLFLTMTGFSAFLLTLIVIVIFVFATQYARRYAFQAFWFTHHWYVLFYIFMFLHGSGRLVQDPLFGNFFLGPVCVYTLDKIISVSRKKVSVSVTNADMLPSGVVALHMKRPTGFEFKAGQWVRVACSKLNPEEYHPFTISSAPHEEEMTMHVRAIGPWTHNIREVYDPANLQGAPYPKLSIDGPFGEGHQDWYQFDVAILVGAGIGITPFSSILKDIVHKYNIGARIQCKKVYFLWVTRTQKQYEWFTDVIREVEEADTKGLVEMHIFVTQLLNKFDLRTTMLYACERHFQKLSGRSLFTGLRSVTHFGRPDFKVFFDSLQEDHFTLPKVGVFSCGPPSLTNAVEDACSATNRFEGPAFVHHFENF